MSFRNHFAALSWRYSRRIRWALAVCCLLLALLTWTEGGNKPQVRDVPVATRDIPAGATITAEDLTIARTELPLDTPTPDELVGEIVRGPVAVGEPVTRSRLVPGQSMRPPPGTVVFPLTVNDERIAELLNAGDHVDILVAPDSLHDAKPRVAARDVEVLAVPTEGGTGLSTRSGAVILLALDDVTAEELAGLRRSDHVTVAIR